MHSEDFIKRMTELGFTKNEAKAYLSLLRNSPATRYEVSKASGIPRSAIYDVISRLEELGAVSAIYSEPEKYVPLPPKELFTLLNNRFNSTVKELEKFVEGLEPPVAPGNLWSIIGYKNMILKAREMILDAETSVYLSAWDREIKKLKTELKEARDRGIKILIFTFTRTHCRLPNVLSYNIPTAELEKLWKPRLMLIKDDEELLLGEANDQDKKHAAWTKNPAIISTVRDALVLDITFYSYRMGKPVERDLIENQFILDSDIEKLLTKYNPGIKTVPYTAPEPQLVEN